MQIACARNVTTGYNVHIKHSKVDNMGTGTGHLVYTTHININQK